MRQSGAWPPRILPGAQNGLQNGPGGCVAGAAVGSVVPSNKQGFSSKGAG